MKRSAMLVVGGVAAMQLSGCMSGEIETSSGSDAPTFEEFEAATYREADTGLYIVGGDMAYDAKELRELYDDLYASGDALILHKPGGVDAKWSDTQKLNLTYCVSNAFGSNKQRVVNAMAAATGAWMAGANVKFTYVPAQDGSCTASNNSVVFDVGQRTGQPYLARAFFPGDPRSQRNVLIDTSSFQDNGVITLVGILTHELGHTLGFRHEHTRPEAGGCYEDSEWRALTSYDSGSVMHYPHCPGSTNSGDLVVTAKDRQGAAALYGAPGSNPNPDPGPDPTPAPRTESISGSASAGRIVVIKTISVRPGTDVTARFTGGSGDPDLYVSFGSAATTRSYACRSISGTAVESCTATAPAGATTAYISLHAYDVRSSASGSVTYVAR
jgi:serine protease